ncbi:MAG: pitrilysin family protein, partial [Bdellovibrionota bacterium]
ELESRGSEVNAFTTRDYTVYYETVTPNLLEKVMDMESDRMANLKIDEEALKSERMVVFEERRLRTENAPEGKMQEALWLLAFRYHSYRWPVIGTPADLMGLTSDMLSQFFSRYYQPANAAIVLVGDFDGARAFQSIKKYYGKIPARAIPRREVPHEPEQEEERRLILRDKVASEKFMQAYHISSAFDKDSYALDVLANILFEGTSSRAYRKLVDELDIAAGVYGSAYTPTYPGLFIMNCTMKGDLPTQTAEDALARLLNDVAEHGVTSEELSVSIRQLTVQLLDSIRTPYGLGQMIGTVQSIFNDPVRFKSDLAKYMSVSATDIKNVARKYLTPNNRTVVVLVPENKKAKLR